MAVERCPECDLSWAAFKGDLTGLEEALREGADPASNTDCNTALFDAIEKGFAKIIPKLLAAGADLSRRHPVTNETPLTAALRAEQPDVVRELVRGGVDPKSASLSSLVRGADAPSVVYLAQSAGVDLSLADPETGRTALHEAAMYGYLQTVSCLLEEGADRSVRDHWGNTPASAALRNHHQEVARLLAEVSEETE